MDAEKRIKNIAQTKEQRMLLRKNSTPEEATLWIILKGRKILNTQWRRQFSVGPYILDFYCPAIKLAIELDGKYHYSDSGYLHDDIREKYLAKNGIEILRYENKFVWHSQEAMIEDIKQKIEERLVELNDKNSL